MKKLLFLAIAALFFAAACVAPKPLPKRSITNLYDAFGPKNGLHKDFGFSCLLRYVGKTVLFDAGSNADIFRENVQKMHVDLKKLDAIVISHGHFDHLNGIDYVLKINPKVKIYMPYDIFWGAPVPFDATGQDTSAKRDLPESLRYFDGGPTKFSIQQSGRFWQANVEYVKTSKEILPGFLLVATNSPFMGYFSCYPGKTFVEGQFEEADHADNCKNTNLPELSLAIKTEKGQVVIVGCSHSGVERIVEQAKQVTRDDIALVYGGFHLLPFDQPKTEDIARYLKEKLGVRSVAPAHCSGHLAFKVFREQYGQQFRFAGLGEVLEF